MENMEAKTTATSEPKPRDIVCLYSQDDEPFYLQLKKGLNLWERQGHVRWLEVLPGEERSVTLHSHVKRADLILMLLSPDFFADEQCDHIMQLALQERVSRQVLVVPILIRAVNWRLSACKDLVILPHNEQPVASWTLSDEAYASISADLLRLIPAWQIELPAFSPRPRLFQARDLPKGYVARPKAFDEIKHLLLQRQGGQTAAITTALRGAGGFGKTTLALALCHDAEIQAAFPDGTLWVELGEHPPRSLDVLNGVLHALEPSLSGAITLEEARDRWRTALQEQVCLLVIDDVWQAEALLPLLENGPQCRRLVTTRNDLLLPKDAACVLVDAMEPREALTLLCQDLPVEISQATYQPKLKSLVARLGYWPLLLTLARGMLTDLVGYDLNIAEALTTVAEGYQTHGVTAYRLDNTDERQQTVDACLRVSLQHLEKFTHPHYHAMERFQELAVFPEDTDIPLATLQMYWKGSAGLERWETKDLCIRLHRLSLLLTCDLGEGTIRVHDVMRSYLVQRAGSSLSALHARFLDVSKQVLGLKRWVDLPSDAEYLWRFLALHLRAASRLQELQTTLTDLKYLMGKALYVGVAALEVNFRVARAAEQKGGDEVAASLLVSLSRTIEQISHLLRQVQTPAEMGGILLSYLGSDPPFAIQRPVFERELPRPFLTAWHSWQRISSSVLLRTMYGHTGIATSCTVSPDGRFIVSSSYDRTLKVWDAVTGAELRTLSGHTRVVSGCAMSSDGRFIVSASIDCTLKVWDAVTGAELRTLSGHTKGVTDCVVSPDGSFLVSSSYDRTLKVWDIATGTARLSLQGHTSTATSCAVSPDGRLIVSVSSDRTLKVWDAATGQCLL